MPKASDLKRGSVVGERIKVNTQEARYMSRA